MDKLLGIWDYLRNCQALDKDGHITGTKLLPTFSEAVEEALREAYSEGHCDGQNAADHDSDEVLSQAYPRDTGSAWERSNTFEEITKLK